MNLSSPSQKPLPEFPVNVMRYGREEPLPQPRWLRAGPLTMQYQGGFLRYIRLGDHEVLRMIYHAVRDQNWQTVPFVVDEETIDERADSFQIRYTGRCREGGIEFRWKGEIVGGPDGTIQCNIDGEAVTEFQRNRIGFCVLHPIPECVGQSCTITHPDGGQTEARFPESISPHEPFLNIREFQWPVKNTDCSAVLWFVGDVFETEDQRNWTDTSFKTYSTPHTLPRPVTVPIGHRVQQSVELRLVGAEIGPWTSPDESADGVIPIQFSTDSVALPAIGTGFNWEPLGGAAPWLNEIGWHHLRVEVNFQDPDWPEAYRKASEDAISLNALLEVALVFGRLPNYELYSFLKQVTYPALIHSILILSQQDAATPGDLLEQVVAPLRQAIPNALLGAGTNAHFVEINRQTPPTRLLDFLSYSITPQAHAVDSLTVVENAEAQAHTVLDARRWVSKVHVSPVTLRPRFNSDAVRDEPGHFPDKMPFAVDPRQMSLMGAAWTVASLKALGQAGADLVTYYETVGEQGVLQGDRPSAYPPGRADAVGFFAEVGMIFPLYWVLRAVSTFPDARLRHTISRETLKVEALRLVNESANRLLVVNLTSEPQTVSLPIAQAVQARVLDEYSYTEACFDPQQFWQKATQTVTPHSTGALRIDLAPYATVFCEWPE